MGLFDLFAKDPCAGWPQSRRFKPELSLRDHSLSSVALGTPFDALRKFGRPDNKRPVKEENFRYAESGATIGVEDGVVDYFGIALRDDMVYDNLLGTDATLVHADGAAMELTGESTLTEVREFLGETPRIDRKDEEIVVFYEMDGHTLEFEAQLDERLKRVNYYKPESDS